jgi:hypothetical protein
MPSKQNFDRLVAKNRFWRSLLRSWETDTLVKPAIPVSQKWRFHRPKTTFLGSKTAFLGGENSVFRW